MPNCFALTPKGSSERATLQSVDEAICKHFNCEVHPRLWCEDWYNVIGFLIATKADLGTPELQARVADWRSDDSEYTEKLLQILAFLEERYISDAWVEIGKR